MVCFGFFIILEIKENSDVVPALVRDVCCRCNKHNTVVGSCDRCMCLLWVVTNLLFIGWKHSLMYEADNMDNVSLISEEDLLTTIFCSCDTERTGLSVDFHCCFILLSPNFQG